jgi:hypothetical protein
MGPLNHDFWKNESGLFFTGGLDRPNQLENADENRRFAQADFASRDAAVDCLGWSAAETQTSVVIPRR